MKQRVNEQSYQREVQNSDIPVLVEFFAAWCGKCAMMEDIIEELSREADGRYKICQIEIDESPVLAAKFAIEIVPTFLIMKEGIPTAAASGIRSKEVLLEMLELTG